MTGNGSLHVGIQETLEGYNSAAELVVLNEQQTPESIQREVLRYTDSG